MYLENSRDLIKIDHHLDTAIKKLILLLYSSKIFGNKLAVWLNNDSQTSINNCYLTIIHTPKQNALL